MSHVDSLAIVGLGEMEKGFHETVMQSSVIIHCDTPTANIVFMHSSNVSIEMVTISNCGYHFYEQYYHTFLHSTLSTVASWVDYIYNISVAAIEVHDMYMYQVSVQNCSGFGFVAINVYGLSIIESSFSQNNLYTVVQGCPGWYCCGGNMAIHYTNPYVCPPEPIIYVTNITNTNASFGVDLYNVTGVSDGRGIFIHMEQPSSYRVAVILESLVLYGNTASRGANLMIETTSALCIIRINNIVSSHGNRVYPLIPKHRHKVGQDLGSGIGIISNVATKLVIVNCGHSQLQYNYYLITITNSVFTHNTCAISSTTVFIGILGMAGSTKSQEVVLENITIANNIGIALSITSIDLHVGVPATFACKNMLIVNASKPLTYGASDNIYAIYLLAVYNIIFEGLIVADNNIGGMLMDDASATMIGYNIFRNNTAVSNGGAIRMSGSSTIVMNLKLPSLLYLVDNHAGIFGGAIFVDQTGKVEESCFFDAIFDSKKANIIVVYTVLIIPLEWLALFYMVATLMTVFNKETILSIYTSTIVQCFLMRCSTTLYEMLAPQLVLYLLKLPECVSVLMTCLIAVFLTPACQHIQVTMSF